MKKKIRNCKAWRQTGNDTLLIKGGSPLIITGLCHGLQSYGSLVAIEYERVIYLLPRWDYSVTTLSHIRKWLEDDYPDLAKQFATKKVRQNELKNFVICDGYKLAPFDGNMRTF